MKKRILVLIIVILLTTGCTCEYNLTIDRNTYNEEIKIISETTDELNNFNNKWEIPIDKDEYELLKGLDETSSPEGNIYKYNLKNNELTFNYDFSQSNISNSTAAYSCFNKVTVTDYNDTTIISTSNKVDCFDKYPTLTNIKVTINVDREVINNNADDINGKKYIWNITRDNKNNKSINLVLNNKDNTTDKPLPSSSNNNKKNVNDYVLYIFLLILVIIIYLGYKWFMKFKDKNNNID